jgi:hypothetical protein
VEAPHAARARELLSGAFQFASLRAATEALLAATRAPPRRASPLAPSPEGRTLWTEGFRARADEDDDGEAKRAVSRETRASREAREARSAPAPPTRRAAETLAKALASDLARTRRDVVAFASANGNRDGTLADAVRGRRSEIMSSERARAVKKRLETRLARLESFAHAECAAGVKSYAAFLEAKLDALSNALDAEEKNRAVETPTPESAAAERVLLIALAASVASEELSEELSSFLGPASSWDRAEEEADGGGEERFRERFRARAARRRAAARGAVPGGALASTTAALRAVADRGFRRWADRAARSIRIELERALLADASLVSEERREDWEEEPEAAAAEIAARLPALASPYAFAAAHAACAEALRCGGHALPPAAARALAAAAAREALAAYRARLDGSLRESVKSVSEKGALQALFDVKFLYETFHEDPSGASRQDSSRGEEDAEAALARANALALRGVVAAASAALDPIDWATYEAPLWRAVARARALGQRRCSGWPTAPAASGRSTRRSPNATPRRSRAREPRRRRRPGSPTYRWARPPRGSGRAAHLRLNTAGRVLFFRSTATGETAPALRWWTGPPPGSTRSGRRRVRIRSRATETPAGTSSASSPAFRAWGSSGRSEFLKARGLTCFDTYPRVITTVCCLCAYVTVVTTL